VCIFTERKGWVEEGGRADVPDDDYVQTGNESVKTKREARSA